ncbi:HesA/MoeB/ThiF family protein [Arcanobacterium canis]
MTQNGRYDRHLNLAGFDACAQEKIEHARVAVIGSGGLGSPVLLYLAAAGVGTLGLIDNDVVDTSNLQRQVIHDTPRAGMEKTFSAAQSVRALNPSVEVVTMQKRLTPQNARETLASYDIVVDCSDNFPTRYLVDEVCQELSIPHVWGAVTAYYGQVSVFTHEGNSRLGDLYPYTEDFSQLPSPAEKGTFGPMCGMVGSLMAGETLKMITGIGHPLVGRIALIDTESSTLRTVAISK